MRSYPPRTDHPEKRERRPHLQANVGPRRDRIGGKPQVRLAVHKVDADERLAALSLVALETLAAGVGSHDDALRPVEAVVVVAGAGARKDHRWGQVAE